MDGKALRVRQTLIFEDKAGKELAKIQERMHASRTAWKSKAPVEIKWPWSRRP